MNAIKVSASLAVVVGAGLAQSAGAQLVVLEDRNSRASFDTSTQAGQFEWRVNGTNHLFQQWFWVRAHGDAAERSIDTLTRSGIFSTDTNPLIDPRIDTFSQSFTEPAGRYRIDASFQLRGDGPQTISDILEGFTIRNLTPTPLSLSFFQYCDFDLNGTFANDSGQILVGPGGVDPRQTELPFVVEETAITPTPSHYQIALWPVILNLLNDALPTTLNDFGGPLGPADLAWALEWDINLGPNGEFQISKDKQLTPAPGAPALLGLGGLLAARRRRR